MKHTLKDLKYSMVDVTPISYDWTEGYPEKWDFTAACRCDKCGGVVIGRGDGKHNEIDTESGCDGYVESNEGPMMSYYYRLPEFSGDLTEAATAIKGLPLVIITFEDSGEHALALSGGGMDLSWQICEAFMRLGYFPPSHFSDLPQMCGRGHSAKDRWIIAACRKSLQCQKERAGRSLRRLRENFKAEAP
jgi:hypothetical protein